MSTILDNISDIHYLLEKIAWEVEESDKKDQIIENLQRKLEEYASELTERELDIQYLQSTIAKIEADNERLFSTNKQLLKTATDNRMACTPGFGVDMSKPRPKYAHMDEDTSFSNIRTAITNYDDHNWG